MEALVLSLVTDVFFTELTPSHQQSLNPAEEALMSPSLHICTHMHALVFSKKNCWWRVFMKLYYFQMEVMNKTWRKQVGETGNLKKQKWRGMELGKKKQSFSSPAHSPSLSKRPTCQLHALKNRGTVCHTGTHGRERCVWNVSLQWKHP